MKRVRCPKCENFLTFDETKYTEGQSLVFICDHCKKQFSIRLGKSKVQAPRKEEKLDEKEFQNAFGSITVIENVFGFKQVLPLQEGDNVIGRRCIGTEINVPIETSDMSMDRRHCIINVKRNKQGGNSLYSARCPQPDRNIPEQRDIGRSRPRSYRRRSHSHHWRHYVHITGRRVNP